MCAVLNRAVKMWDLHPSAVQGSRLPRCSALISAHTAALQPPGRAALEQLCKMEGGGDDVPGEGQADLTPLPAAKCSVGTAVITQNRVTVCASSKRQSLLEIYQGIAWGSDFLQEPSQEMMAPCPTVPGSCPSPPPFKLPVDTCYSLGTQDTGLDLTRNGGRVWAERRKGPALTSQIHHTWLSPTAQDTRGPSLAEVRGSKAAPVTALSLWDPNAPELPALLKQRHILPMESSSSQVTTFSSHGFAARSLLKCELLQPQLAQPLASVST